MAAPEFDDEVTPLEPKAQPGNVAAQVELLVQSYRKLGTRITSLEGNLTQQMNEVMETVEKTLEEVKKIEASVRRLIGGKVASANG